MSSASHVHDAPTTPSKQTHIPIKPGTITCRRLLRHAASLYHKSRSLSPLSRIEHQNSRQTPKPMSSSSIYETSSLRNIETAMNELPLFLSRFLARPKRIRLKQHRPDGQFVRVCGEAGACLLIGSSSTRQTPKPPTKNRKNPQRARPWRAPHVHPAVGNFRFLCVASASWCWIRICSAFCRRLYGT